MFATVSIRLSALQSLLTLLVQQNLPGFLSGDVTNPASLARSRARVTNAMIGLLPDQALDMAVRGVIVLPLDPQPDEPQIFRVAGVGVQSVSLQTAAPGDRVPFLATLMNNSLMGPAQVRSREAFSVGVEVTCALDVRLRIDGRDPVVVRVLTSWLLGAASDDPFALGVDALMNVRPLRTVIASAASPGGVTLPATVPSMSPLGQIASDLQVPIREALQSALRRLPDSVDRLRLLLPRTAAPLNSAVFVTGPAVGAGAITAPSNEQFRYVAQIRWFPQPTSTGGHGSFPYRSWQNSQTRRAWGNLLVDRPTAALDEDVDILADVDGSTVGESMAGSIVDGIRTNLPTITRGMWRNFLFDAPDEAPAGADAAATTLLNTFRGNPMASTGQWFVQVPMPWRTIVTWVASMKQDTVALTGMETVESPEVALAKLEKRLFAQLASRFDAVPVDPAQYLSSDTTPPVAPPTASEIVDAFTSSSFGRPPIPPPREVYISIHQARKTLENNLAAATLAQRNAAEATLRHLFSGCAGYANVVRTQSRVSPSLGGLPGIQPPSPPTPQVDLLRGEAAAQRAFETSVEGSMKEVTASDPTVQMQQRAAVDAARETYRSLLTPHPGTSCTFTTIAEPPHIRNVLALRLIEIVRGGPFRPFKQPSDENNLMASLARGLRGVQLVQSPAVSVDRSYPNGVVLQVGFRLRCLGILEHVPVPGDDLVVRSDTTVILEIGGPHTTTTVSTSGITTPSPTMTTPRDARSNLGTARVLRVTLIPHVSVRLEDQSHIGELARPVFAAVIASLAPPYLALPIFGILLHFTDPTRYDGRLSRGVSEVGDFFRPALERLSGSVSAPDRPVIFSNPHRLVYTIRNFESAFLNLRELVGRSIDLSSIGVASVASSLSTRDDRVRFTAVLPSAVNSLLAPLRAPLPGAATGHIPEIRKSFTWPVCAVIDEAVARRRNPMAMPPMSPARITLSATLSAPTVSPASVTVTNVIYEGAAFSMLVRDGSSQVTVTHRTSGMADVVIGGTVTFPRVLTALVGSLDITVLVEPDVLLRRLPRTVGMSAPIATIVIRTNVGSFAADFTADVERLRQWAPIFDTMSTEGREIENRWSRACDMRSRTQLVPVTEDPGQGPFPFDRLSPSGLMGDPLGVGQPRIDRERIVPRPTGDPRPILDRPWLFAPSPSPVLRLDPIADIALRAARPQPVTPSA